MARKSQGVGSRGAWPGRRGQHIPGGVVRKRGGIQGFSERVREFGIGREGSSYLDPFPTCRQWAPFWLKQIWPIPWERDCSWWAPKTSLGKHWTRLASLLKPLGASATLFRCFPADSPRMRAGWDSPWCGSTSPQKGGDGQRRGGPPARAGEPGEERGDSRMGRVLILGTSPSQDFLLTMLLPSWFFMSPRGFTLLESLNVAGFFSERIWLKALKAWPHVCRPPPLTRVLKQNRC